MYLLLTLTTSDFRWKKTEVLETESITEYELPDERQFEVTEDVVQISEKKGTFDGPSGVTQCEEENGQDNPNLELEEGLEQETEQEKCCFTI